MQLAAAADAAEYNKMGEFLSLSLPRFIGLGVTNAMYLHISAYSHVGHVQLAGRP